VESLRESVVVVRRRENRVYTSLPWNPAMACSILEAPGFPQHAPKKAEPKGKSVCASKEGKGCVNHDFLSDHGSRTGDAESESATREILTDFRFPPIPSMCVGCAKGSILGLCAHSGNAINLFRYGF
jgi:hypothetical protein